MDAKTEEGEGRENSSPLKETVRIQFVHQRDIGIAREFAFFAPRSLRFSSAPRKHIPPFDSFTALARRVAPALHRLRTSISVWEKGLVTPFSFPPLPLSSPSPIQRRLSLPRYNATPSNPIHRCFSHPHIAVLDQSTTSYWVTAPHCVSRKSHNHYS